MALSWPLAMLNTQRPAGERAKRLKLAKEMVSWVQLPPTTGYTSSGTTKVKGKERLIDRTKPGQDRMYLTHEAKGHGARWPWATPWQQGDPILRGDQLLPTGLEAPLGANWVGVGATGDSAVVLQPAERVELRKCPPRGLGGPQVEHKLTHGSGGK